MDTAAPKSVADERLSRIQTLWTMVQQAHGPEADEASAAQSRLVQRYSGAVHSYLLGAVRDPEAADELFQEFALRVVRGDFGRADPGRGRFRDYLRKALINLVNDHHRARRAWHLHVEMDKLQPVAPGDDDEHTFVTGWRQELLDRTWRTLEETLPVYHAVLRFRIENPDVPSPAMAEQLSPQLDKPMSAESVRKTLQRAHEKFADLLLEEVELSLGEGGPEDLENELKALDLLKYCRPAVERRIGKR
jgi:RNA polymerase sigma-70 factor (ECF subfamily)